MDIFGISPASTKCTNGAADKLLQVRSHRLKSLGTSTPPRVVRERSISLVTFYVMSHYGMNVNSLFCYVLYERAMFKPSTGL